MATAESDQAPTESDDAEVPINQNPDLDIAKEVAGIVGADESVKTEVTAAGDVISYTITVTNA
ncbi:MAG: hypothetical protein ACK55Z_18395, partial [bacterium]